MSWQQIVMRTIFRGPLVLLIGALFWFGIDKMGDPREGASFLGLVWIMTGIPISFVLYPLAYWLTRSMQPLLRYSLFPLVVICLLVPIYLADIVSRGNWIELLIPLYFALAVIVSWIVFVFEF